MEVGTLISQGCSNREIAVQLKISEHTVKRHVSNIMNKLMVSRRSQIAAIAITESWRNDGGANLEL
jgi:DNA-binding NarL/FixJ family response regulator